MSDYADRQLDKAIKEQIRRETEALRLYEPMPHQEAFHKSLTQVLVMQKGNQVGGTLAGAVEVARALTNSDPYHKYPTTGTVACLGYGEKHIGKVFYPKLFKPGAFDIIQDKLTKRWRTYRPWDPEKGGDLDREHLKRPAPPLIPPRFIKEISWEKRSERIFSVVRFTTGWELWAFNSAGDPHQAQGFQCKMYWVDEDLATAGWISEILFRLLKQEGYLRWTALPHGKNDEMLNLLNQSDKQKTEESTHTIEIIKATTYDNKYIPEDVLERTIHTAKALGEDVYRQRILGELNLDSYLMYPTFTKRIHDIAYVKPHSTEAHKILLERAGEPPDDWTRYVSIDPGHNVLAIMFLAVPPPDLGDQIFIYDECYIKQATDRHFGEAMLEKCRDRVFQAFIIDFHGGKVSSINTGEMPIDKYQDALREVGIKSESRGFWPGMDDRRRRETDMRNLLALRRDENPTLMVVGGRCPNFCSEMERFKKKTVKHAGKDIPLDEGNRRADTHAIEAVEQAIGIGLEWYPQKKRAVSGPLDIWNKWVKMNERKIAKTEWLRRGGDGHISLGPNGDRG